jgi:2-polyprenyl-3-methyl-5-hydroxy-6-metoxy-1,4-benzoquinol methylase
MSNIQARRTLTDSQERIVPERVRVDDSAAVKSLALHVDRYQFAGRFLADGRALDIACGVGYGSEMLRDAWINRPGVDESALAIDGVDSAAEAIEYARQRFSSPGLTFHCAEAIEYLKSRSNTYTTIISLETLEHLPQPAVYLDAVYKALRPQGVFVVSVPISPTVDINPHHLHDFDETSFLDLLATAGFRERSRMLQVQRPSLTNLTVRKGYRSRSDRRSLWRYYLNNPRALARRLRAICVDGLSTRYLCVAVEKS